MDNEIRNHRPKNSITVHMLLYPINITNHLEQIPLTKLIAFRDTDEFPPHFDDYLKPAIYKHLPLLSVHRQNPAFSLKSITLGDAGTQIMPILMIVRFPLDPLLTAVFIVTRKAGCSVGTRFVSEYW